MDLKSKIPVFPNWPKEGINFLDITGILNDYEAFNFCIAKLTKLARLHDATSIVAIESRGFVFGSPVALLMNVPLIIVRKPNKLPGETKSISYDTEYSSDSLFIKADASLGIKPFIIDDLVATGGTISATVDLIKNNFPLSFKIGVGAVINLGFLPGEKKLLDNGIELKYLVNYDE